MDRVNYYDAFSKKNFFIENVNYILICICFLLIIFQPVVSVHNLNKLLLVPDLFKYIMQVLGGGVR